MVKKNFKIDKILFAETMSKYYYPYQTFYNPLKGVCKKIISFDIRWNYLVYGKDRMNDMFLELIKREKPDLIFMWINCDEYDLDKLLTIRKISPKTQLLLFFGDDDFQFESFSRYFMLFLDYGLIAQKKYIPHYYKDGIKNVFFVIGLDKNHFKPLNLDKKYDITFIGAPREKATGRYELIKFLKDNNVKIKLFGWNWEKYPEFKDIYGGPLESEQMVEVLNQSKINLCFSKAGDGKPHLKGKVFEASACKTFVLTEFCEDYLELFREGKEIVMFKTKEELLQKINYYLKNEKQREEVANAAYKKTIQNYDLSTDLKKIFRGVYQKNKKLIHKPLPKINKKIITLFKKDLNLTVDELKTKLANYDYILFSRGRCQNLKWREYLQSYSLEKTGKAISCCNYYVYSKILGDYLHFYSGTALRMITNNDFNSLLNINQIMVTKEYFLKNIGIFKDIFNRGKITFVTKKNTAFVGFPLIRIKKVNNLNYESMTQVFDFKFLYQLFSLRFQKKFFLIPYILALFLEIIKGKRFIFRVLLDNLRNKKIKDKIKSFKKCNFGSDLLS